METYSVDIGARVVVRLGDKEREFEIVSPGGADAVNGCISCDSPIAKSIFGKKVGYVGRVILPNKIGLEICIIDIQMK